MFEDHLTQPKERNTHTNRERERNEFHSTWSSIPKSFQFGHVNSVTEWHQQKYERLTWVFNSTSWYLRQVRTVWYHVDIHERLDVLFLRVLLRFYTKQWSGTEEVKPVVCYESSRRPQARSSWNGTEAQLFHQHTKPPASEDPKTEL